MPTIQGRKPTEFVRVYETISDTLCIIITHDGTSIVAEITPEGVARLKAECEKFLANNPIDNRLKLG